jgi:high-affinity iron transporter
MLPSLLITFREIIEAALIVATILGILTKLGQQKELKTVWYATGAAAVVSILLLAIGSVAGLKIQELYSGHIEAVTEGTLMVVSAMFITWAVFFLHKYFGRYKTQLLARLQKTVEQQEQRGLFILVFTAVFREGFEIVLFLSTVYVSSNPLQIFTGAAVGALMGLLVCFGLFKATLRMPVFYAFRVTSALLIFFAAGLLARGVHEFTEVGLVPELGRITLAFLPTTNTFIGSTIGAVLGITRHMDITQLSLYLAYTVCMGWWVFMRGTMRYRNTPAPEVQD